MSIAEVNLSCAPDELAENVQHIARLIDPEYRDAETDLQSELHRLGVNSDDVLIPLDIVLTRLTWIAYRTGFLAAKQH